jgi:predicted transcriptional regulator
MPQTPNLVQLDSTVQARLAALANERKQPISDVAAEIIAMYCAAENWGTENEFPAATRQCKRMTLEELMEGIPEGAIMQEID